MTNRIRSASIRLQLSGLFIGALFFAASLTPSLIPRSFEVQGVLSGLAFGAGYAIGVLLYQIWRWLDLPDLGGRPLRVARVLIGVACLSIICVALYHSANWQNSVRHLVGMEPLDSAYPVSVTLLAIVVFSILLFVILGLIKFGNYMVGRLKSWLPRGVSILIGWSVTIALAVILANGVLVKYTFRLLDASFQQLDALIEPDRPQPLIVERAGNPSSRLDWQQLGRTGRGFVSSGPRAEEITAFSQRTAREPIRLYAGLQNAGSAQDRAALLLDELIAVKAFERRALVIITPTGTGWIDPSAIDGLEFLLDGDVASVALQYSYLNSPLSLLFQPDHGLESAQALFRVIYDHWTTLPPDSRPKLYLHGLSLGAFNSQRSVTLFDVLDDPIDGAVWSGPPFPSEQWRSLTQNRDPGSAEWLPVVRSGRFARFMNQNGAPDGNTSPWGNVRIVFLQYGSDAITFFDKSLFYRAADWMNASRAPDVSPLLRWYPVVTMLQLLIDMPLSDTVPMGYGHVYAPEHYLNAWLEVTGDQGWPEQRIAELKALLKQRSMRGDGYDHRGG